MLPSRPTHPRIWGLAFGYFAFYIPYSALTKALSQGLLPGARGAVQGLLLLPATTIATTLGLLAIITATGGWARMGRRTASGWVVPSARIATVCSGLATAVIIASTTLNYTFVGISILLALLMMRGGVLILAPIVDTAFGRRVDAFSWAALAASFVAVAIALSEVSAYRMTIAAAMNIAAYLTGYMIRLSLMTHAAKSGEAAVNLRYFYEETAVAAVALTAVPALVALVGPEAVAGPLRAGFTTFLATPMVWPALAIGLLYSCLYVFGTGVYLDERENTFCVPLNRCASLLSGLVSSLALTYLLGSKPPSAYQVAGALVILAALSFLILSAVRDARRIGPAVARRVFLFVCGGNTSRSPMAQAICNDQVARMFGVSPIVAMSAGVTAEPGRPLTGAAASTLAGLGVKPHDHASRPVTPDLIAHAERVFCMTEDQRAALVARFPEAAAKIQRLDPAGDLDDPSGQDAAAYTALGERLQALVRQHLAMAPV